MRFLKIFFLSVVLTLFAACSTQNLQPENSKQWHGRFSIKTEKNGVVDRNTGTFVLTASPDYNQLLLKGPLGAAAASLTENSQGAVLDIPNEEPMRAADSKTIIARVLGAPLDLQELIKGLETNQFSENSLKTFRDLGWNIQTQTTENKTISRITASREESAYYPAVVLILLPQQ